MNAIVFNTDDDCMPRVWLMLHSIREYGDFDGDIICVSSCLSDSGKRFLEANGVVCWTGALDHWNLASISSFVGDELERYSPLLADLAERVDQLEQVVGTSSDSSSVLRLVYLTALRRSKQFGAKRLLDRMFSKTLLVSFLKQHPDKYEKLIVIDSDVIVQGPLEPLFDEIDVETVSLAFQFEHVYPGHHAFFKNAAIQKASGQQKVVPIAREPSGGVVGGSAKNLLKLYETIDKTLSDAGNHQLFAYSFWDEDIIRQSYLEDTSHYRAFSSDKVVNLASFQYMHYETQSVDWLRLVHKQTKQCPTLVHLNAESYKAFDRIREIYDSSPAQLYFSQLPDFDMQKGICFGKGFTHLMEVMEREPEVPRRVLYLGCFVGQKSYGLGALANVQLDLVDGCIWNNSWVALVKRLGLYDWFVASVSHMQQDELLSFMHQTQSNVRIYDSLDSLPKENAAYDTVITGRATREDVFENDLLEIAERVLPEAHIIIEGFIRLKPTYQKHVIDRIQSHLGGNLNFELDALSGDLWAGVRSC